MRRRSVLAILRSHSPDTRSCLDKSLPLGAQGQGWPTRSPGCLVATRRASRRPLVEGKEKSALYMGIQIASGRDRRLRPRVSCCRGLLSERV